jgi:hypothetical protein
MNIKNDRTKKMITCLPDVISTLTNAEDYLSALRNMTQYQKDHGKAFVSIGVTGKGKAPHYRVDLGEPDWDELLPHVGFDPDTPKPDLSRYFKAYDGNKHHELPWGVGGA